MYYCLNFNIFKCEFNISAKPSLPNGSSPPVVNGSTIIRTPPASSSGGSAPRAAAQQKCNRHAKSNGHKHPHRKHTPSTSTSQQSFKGDASQIQRVAGDGKAFALFDHKHIYWFSPCSNFCVNIFMYF